MISLDIETRSEADLPKVGQHKYAEDPTTRILLLSINDGKLHRTWDAFDPESLESTEAKMLLARGMKGGETFSAFNASFEHAVLAQRLLPDVGLSYDITPDQWRCSKFLALRACIPSSLATSADFLDCDFKKDSVGKRLIEIFSVPKDVKFASGLTVTFPSPVEHADEVVTVAGEKVTVAEAWRMFRDYCVRDVVVEMEVAAKLSGFADDEVMQAGFAFDMRMNDRGAPVHTAALDNALRMVEDYQSSVGREFRELTGLNQTQNAKVKAWLKARGYQRDDLQADTISAALADDEMTDELRHVLTLYSYLSYAAIAKLPTMKAMTCADGRLRSQFIFHGARTGRWTSKGVQLQNAKRPVIADPDGAFADVVAAIPPDVIEHTHGPLLGALSSVVRNFIHPGDGRMMLDVDYSNIEGRVAAWLAGETKKLDHYRTGADLYKVLAADVFHTPVEDITKDQRFVGKVGDLSLQFGSGARKFWETCAAWGQPIDKTLADHTVRTYRDTYRRISQAWQAYADAAKAALQRPDKWFRVGEGWGGFDDMPPVWFAYTAKGPFPRLVMRLPSGRKLCFPKAELHTGVERRFVDFLTGEVTVRKTDQIRFYGPVPQSSRWTMIGTHGADLFQSATQATAFDIMLHGCLTAEQRGFDIFAVIHDQALAVDGDPDAFIAALTDHPEWLPDDFPLAAEGGRVPYYSK